MASIVRSTGTTPSEQYLAKLADRTFLNLWSYPNLYIDKRRNGTGDGKELCDLLVVCGDHVLIFSDKTINCTIAGDADLAWRRWFKRAVQKSANQVQGAARWIDQFPERVFLDPKCTQQFPLPFPTPERRKIHGVVVALGAGDACKEFFGEGIGSLMITPKIKGNEHIRNEGVIPFSVGDVNPGGPFVHVLDDATLDIVMGELDTVTDLTNYLTRKEWLIRSDHLIAAGGEEDLVAYYMTHMSEENEHDFTRPDGSSLNAGDAIFIDTGIYSDLTDNPQYIAKKQADQSSYIWDKLIEAFTNNMLAGTTIVPDGRTFDLAEHEQVIRHMALVPRYVRRLYGQGIIDALEKSKTTDRFTRAFLPTPEDVDQETSFFFLTLAMPKIELEGGYEQYRATRRNMLEVYAFYVLTTVYAAETGDWHCYRCTF